MTASSSSSAAAEKPRALVLERFAPYRIVALGHAIGGLMSRVYAHENLTVPEWRVLAVVSQADRLAARDVVRRTPMDKMTVSRAVASLEAKGYVARATDRNDRRVSMLSLSVSGRALFERVAARALDAEAELLAALSPAERAAFDSALAKLEARVREAG